MLLHVIIFTLASFATFFQAPLDAHGEISISKSYIHSIVNGLMCGIASQVIIQEPSKNPRLGLFPRYGSIGGHKIPYTFPLECFYYAQDEFFLEEDYVHNACQGIGALAYAWYALIHQHNAIPMAVKTDRAAILQSAIIHACDGNYDEFRNKDSLIFYKAIGKMLVRSAIASTIFSTSNGNLTPISFAYQYGIFEVLLPLIDLIEKIPALNNWSPYNKKRLSRLIKSIMRCAVYSKKEIDGEIRH